jgi:hypothetical protein
MLLGCPNRGRAAACLEQTRHSATQSSHHSPSDVARPCVLSETNRLIELTILPMRIISCAGFSRREANSPTTTAICKPPVSKLPPIDAPVVCSLLESSLQAAQRWCAGFSRSQPHSSLLTPSPGKALSNTRLPSGPVTSTGLGVRRHPRRRTCTTTPAEVPFKIPDQVAPHRQVDPQTREQRLHARRHLSTRALVSLPRRPPQQTQVIAQANLQKTLIARAHTLSVQLGILRRR